MAAERYQKVYIKLWLSESFRALSTQGRILFLYLLTCPNTTMLTGLVAVTVGAIADHLEMAPDDVRAALTELDAEGMAAFDPAGVVWLPNALTHNPPANPSVVKGWRRHWSEVPACPLKVAAYQSLRLWCERKGTDWLGAFDAACARPVLSAGRGSAPQKPAARHGVAHGVPHRVGDGVAHGVGDGAPHGVAHQYQEQYQEQEQKNLPPTPLGGGMRVRTHESAHEDAPATSPSGRVVAEVVSTEAPPSRQPPAPVEVAPSSPTPASAPSCDETAPLAAPVAEDDDQPPPAQRVPSTPRPEPVAAVAPPAPVETAPVAPTPAPIATPSGQVSLLDAEPKADSSSEASEAVREVFAHWTARLWTSRVAPKLSTQRVRRIRARLRDGFSVADLCKAIDGATFDDWLMGRKQGARPDGYRDVDTVLRDVAQVERLMALATQRDPKHAPPPPPPPPMRVPAHVKAVVDAMTPDQKRLTALLYTKHGRRPTAAEVAMLDTMSPEDVFRRAPAVVQEEACA